MASWLKVAEDLLEVVDRKAKLVANELSDEQSGSQDSVKSRQLRFKGKGQPRKTIGRIGKSTETEQKQPLQEEFNLKVDKIDDSRNEVTSNHKSEAFSEVIYDARKDQGISNVAYSGVAETIGVDNDINGPTMIPTTENNDEISCSTASDTASVANFEVVPEMTSSFSKDKGSEDVDMIQLTNINPKGSAVVVDTSVNETTQKHDNVVDQETEKTLIPEVFPNANGQAQGLLKAAVSTGNSKESRLAKVCAGLSSRLQECKSENAQLEELLSAERELSSSYEVRIKQLHQDLSALKAVVERAETNMDEVLTAKNSEIESLVATVDNLKKQLCTSEEKNVSLQVNMETVTRSRELTENRMIQALREELAIAERRAEEERVAHNATKMAAVEREIELEHRAVEASNALSSIQRKADESTSRVAELEHKVALLDVECASLTQELQELEARNRRGQKKASEETSQILQVQAWQEEVERSRHCQRDAENKLSLVEAELQKMRVVMAGMKRDAEHYSRQEHMELEKRYRELTDLLYHKQTQLEAMASEKAAAFMQLEKEIKRLQETQVEAEKSGTSRRSSVLWEEDTDIKALETLPLHHRNMATASRQLQRAAKLLDSGAVRATRFLWRYPAARVSLLIYLVFVHLFLMYLLHRLQAQAEDFSSREVAASMGLGNSSLP